MSTYEKQDLEGVLTHAFLRYSAYNIQRRGIPEVRDGLKFSTRQLLHAQHIQGFTHNKPFKKAMKSVSAATGFSYVHGEDPAFGTFIRMGKPFATRYPLQDVQGSYGTLMSPHDHASSRYVEIRGSELASHLMKDLEKDTVTDWEDTYDMEGKFPLYLPAKGFHGFVNGAIGISSGMACSIPPLNLREYNEALIKLLWNPNISNEEILCYPDFPTGGTILNLSEVKESLLKGTGKSAKVRGDIEYDKKRHALVVRSMPYSTYTNTVCDELAQLLNEDDKTGIESFNDFTGLEPHIEIKLTKRANPTRVLKLLYQKTSLQNYFGINMTMIDKGVSPRIFSQREVMEIYLEHQKDVFVRGFIFERKKWQARLHIIEGLLIALASIEEVIKTIKESSSTANASINLQKNFILTEIQAKAILDIKLSRIAKLEVQKFKDERITVIAKIDELTAIINSEELTKKEIEKELRSVAQKFGDARRTVLKDIETEDSEPVEIKSLQLNLTNLNNLLIEESSSLLTQKRGGRGRRLDVNKGEYVTQTFMVKNTDDILVFSKDGYYFVLPVAEISEDEKVSIGGLLSLESEIAFVTPKVEDENLFMIFMTKNGILKKSLTTEYNTKGKGVRAIQLDEGDELVSVFTAKESAKVAALTEKGQFIYFTTEGIRPIGRVTRGVVGVKLAANDSVISCLPVPEDTVEFLTATRNGLAKRTPVEEYRLTKRAAGGVMYHRLDETDMAGDFIPLNSTEKEIYITSTVRSIKINLSEIPQSSRASKGSKLLALRDSEALVGLVKI